MRTIFPANYAQSRRRRRVINSYTCADKLLFNCIEKEIRDSEQTTMRHIHGGGKGVRGERPFSSVANLK